MKGVSAVKYWVDGYDALEAGYADLETLLDFGEDAADDIDAAYKDLVDKLEALEMRNMLGAEGDNLGAVLTINSGAGGTESNDWSSMLMRMYTRWGERNGYKMTVTELLELQYQVANLSIQQELVAKVIDRGSQAIQTLFKNQ